MELVIRGPSLFLRGYRCDVELGGTDLEFPPFLDEER